MSIPHVNLLVARRHWLLPIVVLGLLGLTFVDWDGWRGTQEHEQTVALADVPAPIRTTIEQEDKDGTLKEIDRTTIGGKTTDAAGIVVNGKEHATRIAEDGAVIGRAAAKEDDDD